MADPGATWQAEVVDALEALGHAFEDHVAATEPRPLRRDAREVPAPALQGQPHLREEGDHGPRSPEGSTRLAGPAGGRGSSGCHARWTAPHGRIVKHRQHGADLVWNRLRDPHRRPRRRRLTRMAAPANQRVAATGRPWGRGRSARAPLASGRVVVIDGGLASELEEAGLTGSATSCGRRALLRRARVHRRRAPGLLPGPARASRSPPATRPRSRASPHRARP